MRLPVLMLIYSYALLLLTDALIVKDLRVMSLYDGFKGCRKKKRAVWWKAYGIFAFLVVALLTVAISLPRREGSADLGPIMWMLYVVITILTAQIVYCLFSLIGFIPRLFRKKRWNTGLWLGLPFAVMVFVTMWCGTFVGRYKIQIVEVDIDSKSLPASFNGYKIAQISDLHLGTWGNDTSFISHLVDSVNNLKPDLIVFTGDIVNRETSEIIPFLNVLSRLKAPDGVYSILGNHDYGDYMNWPDNLEKAKNLDRLKHFQKDIGWNMLNNDYDIIVNPQGDSIILVGVENWGEPPFSRYGDLDKAYPRNKQNDNNFKILLSHNPEHWNQEVSKNTNFDLTLSGHTHAMQIMFSIGNWKWSPSKYKYEQWGGLYTREVKGKNTKVYVNIGAGEVGLPMRIGASPEITLFTLYKR